MIWSNAKLLPLGCIAIAKPTSDEVAFRSRASHALRLEYSYDVSCVTLLNRLAAG
jgi:hypothetical protein